MTPSVNANLRSPAAWMRFLLTCAIGLALDLATKVWAFGTLAREIVWDADGRVHVFAAQPVQFIPGWLHFEAVANQGAVFGLGQGQRWLFLTVSAGAICLLTYLFLHSGRSRFFQLTLGMLLAGVLGNMYDRVVHGYVRDMFHAFPEQLWPALIRDTLSFIPYFRGPIFPWIFNVADSFLCVGVAIAIGYNLFGQGQADDKSPAPEVEGAKSEA